MSNMALNDKKRKFEPITQIELNDEPDEEYSLERALAFIGFGKVHFEILFVCGLVVLGIINETIASSLVVLSSQCDFETTPLDRAIMNTSVFAGMYPEKLFDLRRISTTFKTRNLN
ncbi:uncharacterized protein LOC129940969 [Eupeodes corollae]|uniref:uncharacterized protein LOC129940969 n=1 Tax=Eupeodes corollae TaxID=290404 RepID=UPI002491F5C8|nr:uncharacterized protein LOC129940969 [Eupeodes corollae]